jgi:hypothetical protein
MRKLVAFCFLAVLFGCNVDSSRKTSLLPEESLLPPKGTALVQVEEVYGKVERVSPPDLKQPETLHVFRALPRVLLRVHFDDSQRVVWAGFQHLDVKFYPVSAKKGSSQETLEHDARIRNRDYLNLRKRIKSVPWTK